MNVKSLNKRQIKWAMKLAVYNFVILYHSSTAKGASNQNYVQRWDIVQNYSTWHTIWAISERYAETAS